MRKFLFSMMVMFSVTLPTGYAAAAVQPNPVKAEIHEWVSVSDIAEGCQAAFTVVISHLVDDGYVDYLCNTAELNQGVVLKSDAEFSWWVIDENRWRCNSHFSFINKYNRAGRFVLNSRITFY